MLNHLVKWSLIATIWRRYGRILKWLPVLVVIIIVIFNVHADYVNYVKVSQNASMLALSFVIKWFAILGVVIIYWAYALRLLASSKSKNLKNRMRSEPGTKQSDVRDHTTNDLDEESDVGDAFAQLRKKRTLESRADLIIKKKKQ